MFWRGLAAPKHKFLIKSNPYRYPVSLMASVLDAEAIAPMQIE
jgi:hypothetical protein